SPLPPLPIQYADYATWQHDQLTGEHLDQQLTYWQHQLANTPPLNLPTDRPRTRERSPHGELVTFTVDEETTERLREVGRNRNATLFMVLLAAFQAVLADLCRQSDVAVGTPIAGRTRPETEPLIGLFVNTLVLRTDLSGNPTFTQLLDRARDTALAAYAHQDVPFETLVEHLNPTRDLSRTPLFDVMFSYEQADADARSATCAEYPVRLSTTLVDLTLAVTSDDHRIQGGFEFRTDLFDRDRIDRLAEHLGSVLLAVAADPHRPIGALPRLSEDDHPPTADHSQPPPVAPPRFAPPRTPTELALANIWHELLDPAVPLSRHHNFFEAGGHSLLATRAVNRVNATFQITLPLRAIFEYPELTALANVIDTLRWLDGGGRGTPEDDDDYEEVEL
ncbi:MAG TPA: condensation domain-containing protein, partial [Planosporangium sp.]|nr:condensation domain-containing protein [Planosporangium sp.]